MLFLTFLLQVKNFYTLLIINLKLIWSLTWTAIQTFNPFSSARSSIKVQLSHNLRDFTFIWKIKNFSSLAAVTTPNLIKSNSSNSLQKSSIHPALFSVSFGGLSQTWKYLTRSAFLESANNIINRTFGLSFYYIQGFVFVLFIDACLTDDEPLWEPLEWSLVQTWILFIFSFAWIAENLIVSRYGSYTGRDKRVWMSWYKTFWLIEGYYVINYAVAAIFVIVPFYFETNYNLSFVYSWWHWYSRVFFFKFISLLTLIILISYYLQITVRWLNYKKGLFLVLLINIFLSYLIYTQFIITFLGFFTDPVWYQKTRPIDYIQLSHEPARWGWGSAKKDHFTYHGVKTVFWFKNDGPFAAAMIFFQTFLFICIFFLYIYWITLFRRIWSTKEIPLTLTTYCVSSLRQFFYFSLWMYFLVLTSYLANYSRLPIEFLWSIDNVSWSQNFVHILLEYPSFFYAIFFK